MAVKIRFARKGAKNKPCFGIVVTDIRAQRDGMAVEHVGYYDPVKKEKRIDIERIDYWLSKGAKMSQSVHDLYRKSGGQKLEKRKPRKSGKPAPKEESKSAEAAQPQA